MDMMQVADALNVSFNELLQAMASRGNKKSCLTLIRFTV
jgi:hypothetical protein